MPDDILPTELREHEPVKVQIQFETEVPAGKADLDPDGESK